MNYICNVCGYGLGHQLVTQCSNCGSMSIKAVRSAPASQPGITQPVDSWENFRNLGSGIGNLAGGVSAWLGAGAGKIGQSLQQRAHQAQLPAPAHPASGQQQGSIPGMIFMGYDQSGKPVFGFSQKKGIPWWLIIVALIVAIWFAYSAGWLDFALPAGVKIKPDLSKYSGLLTFNGQTWPIKVSHIPGVPLAGKGLREILVVVFTLIALPIVWRDNTTARPNQKPASRANAGLILFVLATFVLGWVGTLMAITGLILMRRPRAGGQMMIWPVLVVVALGLYIWFDFFGILVVKQGIPWLDASIPYVSDFIRWMFNGDNIRPIGLIAYIVISVESMFKKDIDDTTLICAGIIILGWHAAWRVWLFAEQVDSAWISVAIFWLIAGVSLINALQEFNQGGAVGAPFLVMIVSVLGWLAMIGLRSLVAQHLPGIPSGDGSLFEILTTPAASSLLIVFIIAWFLDVQVKRGSGFFKEMADLLGRWSGALVSLHPLPFTIMVDFYLFLAIVWIILLLGTSLPVV